MMPKCSLLNAPNLKLVKVASRRFVTHMASPPLMPALLWSPPHKRVAAPFRSGSMALRLPSQARGSLHRLPLRGTGATQARPARLWRDRTVGPVLLFIACFYANALYVSGVRSVVFFLVVSRVDVIRCSVIGMRRPPAVGKSQLPDPPGSRGDAPTPV